jgi:hypothetical protein
MAENHKKRKWLSLVVDDFTASELRDHGFRFSDSAFTTARKHAVNFGPGAEPPNPQQPLSKRKKTLVLSARVEEFFNQDTISRPAPNRCITKRINGNKREIPVRYLLHSKKTCFALFKRAHPEVQLSLSCFYSMIPPQFKKASKATDLCPICEGIQYYNIIYYIFKLL